MTGLGPRLGHSSEAVAAAASGVMAMVVQGTDRDLGTRRQPGNVNEVEPDVSGRVLFPWGSGQWPLCRFDAV